MRDREGHRELTGQGHGRVVEERWLLETFARECGERMEQMVRM